LERYIEEIKLPSLTEKGFIIGGGEEERIPNVTNVRKEFKTLAFWQGSLKTGKDGKAEFNFTVPDNLTTYRVVAIGQTKANQFGGDASATVKVSKPLLINAALPRFLRDGDEVELRAVVQQNFADSEEIAARCVTDASCKLIGSDRTAQTAARDAPTVFRFKAQVHDVDLAPAKIRFETVAKSDAKMSDAIEITLPVQPPTIVRKESVAGPFSGPQFDAQYRQVLERGIKQFNESLLSDGRLPDWPGGDTANPFVTCQAFWAINESVNAGFEAPEGLREKLAGALKKILNGQMPAASFERCFALFVVTQYQTEDDFKAVSHDLYLRRNDAGDECCALLAIALHRQDIMPREKEQLLRELDAPIKERAFNPKTLSSATRAEAICALAFDAIAPKLYTSEKRQRIRDRMLALMDSSASLSTQEHLWLLLEFKSMIGGAKAE